MTMPLQRAAPPHGTTGTSAADVDARLAPFAATLAGRLGAVCRDWDAATFDALVERIAQTKLRWTDAGYGA